MFDRIFVLIGGGEIKTKATSKIDGEIAAFVKSKVGPRRPTGLFIGTASHDSMPYFNSFRKTYTGEFDIKADCALICYNEMDMQHISDKISKADFIYIGGGDTVFMLRKWAETGMDKLLLEAYNNGTPIVGLSAGAICWFTDMYTDSDLIFKDGKYNFFPGLGVLNGLCCPHYDDRVNDFDTRFLSESYKSAYCIENLSALVFVNEKLTGSVSAGGNSYFVTARGGFCEKTPVKNIGKISF